MPIAKDFREMSNMEILATIEVAARVLETRKLLEGDKKTLLYLIGYLIEILAKKRGVRRWP